jgi:predicted membrane channel-forming protein YqfA (hemolysin III family)
MPLRQLVLVAAMIVAVVATILMPRTAQPLGYHRMADERAFAGIPNALNVLSNLPFAFVGLMGLASMRTGSHGFVDPRDRWPYSALFAGVFLTAICSSYYHLAPDNARLVWDRLPMTVGFMGLLAALISDRVDRRAGRALLAPLLVGGVASVVYWHWTELTGAGDLRPYFLVQFGSLLIVALILLLYPSPWSDTRYILAGLVVYVIAKIFEVTDTQIYALGHIVSGHTLKHLVAAAGVWCLVLMVRNRSIGSWP